jgi:hypothetical protein
MYLDALFKVKRIEHHPEHGRTVRLRRWPRDRRWCVLYGSGLDVEEGDIIHTRIQNHDPEVGWELDSMYGFHYDDERDCEVCA